MDTQFLFIFIVSLLSTCKGLVIYKQKSQGLTSIPNDIPLDVERLDLYNNSITEISVKHFENHTRLFYLELNKNGFVNFPVFNTSDLQELSLKECNIVTVPSYAIAGHQNLYILQLDLNKIKLIEDRGFYGTVGIVYLGDNEISEIDDSAFVGATEVSYLDITNNHVKTTSWLIHLRKSLSTLRAERNEIETPSDDTFVGFEKLHTLALRGNNLKSWPNISPVNATLIILELSENHIKTIPNDAFKAFTKLDLLNLQINQMETFPDLRPLEQSLVFLDMRRNKLSCIPEVYFGNLTKLTDAYFDDNLLKEFPFKQILPSPSIRMLSLRGNVFTTLRKDDIVRPSRLNSLTLFLDYNKLICDCNLAWLTSPNFTSMPLILPYPKALCSQPEALQGVNLDTMDESMFVCGEKELAARKYWTRLVADQNKRFLGTPLLTEFVNNELSCFKLCISLPGCEQFSVQVQGHVVKCDLFDERQCQLFENHQGSKETLFHIQMN